MIRLIDLLENKMTPAQKKKRGEIFDKLVAGGMNADKAGPIATSRAISEKLDDVGNEDKDINNDGKVNKTDKYLLKRRKAISANIKEGDHEVSMAVSSLEAIAEAIVELRQKLGNQERNIPGWIQDHIAKAENYIEQAAQGFHELKGDE
jgi:archaellum component FlaC